MKKNVFNFNSKLTKKFSNPKNLLGGKGANLAEMGRLGFPVPPGFIISTNVCDIFYDNKKKLGSKILNAIKKEILLLSRLQVDQKHFVEIIFLSSL